MTCCSQIDRPHRGQGGSFYFFIYILLKTALGSFVPGTVAPGGARLSSEVTTRDPLPCGPTGRLGRAKSGFRVESDGRGKGRHIPRGSGNRIFNVLNKPRSPRGKVKSVTNVHGENCPHAHPGRLRFAPAEGTGPSVSCGCDSGSFGQSGQTRLCPRPLPDANAAVPAPEAMCRRLEPQHPVHLSAP